MSLLKQLMLRSIPAAMLLPAFARAQQLRSLPLREAISLSRQHSSQLRADSLQYRMADTRVTQTAAEALPQLSVNAVFRRLSDNITPFAIALPAGSFEINPQILSQSYNEIQLSQLLFGGGRVRNGRRAAEREAAASRMDLARNALELDQRVTDLWFNLYNARASAKIIETNITVLAKKHDDLEVQRAEGIILANDVLKIDLAITNLKAGLADVNALSGSLNFYLCLATGLDSSMIIDIPDDYLHPEITAASLEVYFGKALQQRPELKSIQLRSEAAADHIKVAQSGYLPTLNLIGSYSYDRPNQRVMPSMSRFDYSAYAGLQLAWRISSLYTNKARVSESRLGAMQLNSRLQQNLDNIRGEVNSRYLEYMKTQEKLQLVKTEVQQATENYRVEQNKLNAQTTTPVDFLNAHALLLQAQLNMATAKANTELAYYKLLQATGESIQ